jgi:hypothetical protein
LEQLSNSPEETKEDTSDFLAEPLKETLQPEQTLPVPQHRRSYLRTVAATNGPKAESADFPPFPNEAFGI